MTKTPLNQPPGGQDRDAGDGRVGRGWRPGPGRLVRWLVMLALLPLLPGCLYDDVYSPPYSSRPTTSSSGYYSGGHYPYYPASRGYRGGGYRSSSLYDRDYERQLQRDRDRQRERDRAQQRERDRERERDRQRERERDRDRQSSRSSSSSPSASGGGHPRAQAIRDRRADLDERRARGEATSPRARKR